MDATQLHDDALVWDSHSGMVFHQDTDADDLLRYMDAGVGFVSLNAGFDVDGWMSCIKALAAYRAWIEEHAETCVMVRSTAEIRHARAQGKLAFAFDIEGMNALDGSMEMLSLYYALGVRQMTLAYNLNNAASGGCHDEDRGLTDFGRAIVGKMNEIGMVIDCAHVSYRSSMEAIELSDDPVVFSHANCRALADHERNIWDDQIKACAETGGLIGVTGIGLFLGSGRACVDTLVRHIDHIAELVGPAHICIGLDYAPRDDNLNETWNRNARVWPPSQYPDGANVGFMEPEAFPDITAALLGRGYGETDIRGILGENYLRLAERVWK